MAYFEWDPSLETGMNAIDEQHRTLFALANRLQEAVESCPDCDDHELVTDTVYRLTDYVMQHFNDEEAFMRSIGYPRLGAHAMLHELLTAETLRVAADYWNGEDVLPTTLAPMLVDWLRSHIRGQDMGYISYARRRES
jgi:hemerythrin-like metal-binding protein